MKLKIKKLVTHAIDPVYATEGAACFDLKACERGFVRPGSPAIISTGLSVEIPEGYVMLIFSRSGHAFGKNIRLGNCVGVIDSDYRGEIKVNMICDGPYDLSVNPGDRIAQAMVVPHPRVEFDMVDELSTTTRGEGGFGSTGQ